jgi:hypothetical protein
MSKKLLETDRVSVLASFEVAADRARLHFYPYAFDPAPGATPILAVNFVAPQFISDDVAAIDPEEVLSIEVFEDRIEFWSGSESGDDQPHILRAASAACEWREYDLEDFRRRVEQLEAAYQELIGELSEGRRHRDDTLVFIREAIRRAEIKASFSGDQGLRQQEAIAALERVLRRMEDN